ncbi:MAG TPA: hypothetical protein GXX28_05295, partial [Firmicutes bacterium]|nr:hypothetical protein [Bacillota bacterium]
MAVVDMRRVTIIGHQSWRDSVLKELQRLGTVQVDDVRSALRPDEQDALFGTAERAALDREQNPPSAGDRHKTAELDAQAGRIKGALALLDRFFGLKKGIIETFAGIRLPLSEAEYREKAQAEREVEGLVARAEELDRRLTALQAREAEVQARLAALRPWVGLDVPREELRDTRLFRIVTGQFGSADVETLADDLAGVTPLAGCEVVSHGKDSVFAVLYYPKAREEEVLSV